MKSGTSNPEQASASSPPVVIVTGGSRGIGRSIVEHLHADGFAIVFTHSSSDAESRSLEAHFGSEGPAVRGLRVDVSVESAPAQVFDFAETLGRVTGLVNNAGVTGRIGAFRDLTDDDLRRVIEVNLTAPVRFCREAARRWAGRADRSTIVNISSVAARTGSPHEYVAYAATKAAVETLSVGLGRELAASRIHVNAVSPGTVDTTIHARAGEPDRPARVAARIPLGRVGRVDEIAAAVSWLMSSKTSYVTGTVLNVAGGL
jgi:NAD(P)-dependent dehydrogenase (short-subunit alcohol dehydrogenase family)